MTNPFQRKEKSTSFWLEFSHSCVNDVNVVNVSHSVAVEALKRAGNRVELKVKRKRAGITSGEDGPNNFIEVELFKVSHTVLY